MDIDMQAPSRPVGRPRDPNLDVAIRRAALELLGEGGLEACALDEVARRAGVGKATIYRRWPSKDDLVRDAFDGTDPDLLPVADRGSLVADSRELLMTMGAALRQPRARAWLRTVPVMGPESPLVGGLPIGPLGTWNDAVMEIVDRSRRRGEVPGDGLHPIVLQAACSTVMSRWFIDPDNDEAGERALIEQLLAVLVEPLVTA